MRSFVSRLLPLVSCLLLFTSCSPLRGIRLPGAVRPSVKIGLVAPFEGRYRYIGYDVIYAVRLALREANAAGGVGGYSVELVAYDDGADPVLAADQARKLAVDPAVVAAIGHFREGTTAAALDLYAWAGIPLVAPVTLDPAPAREVALHNLPGEAETYPLYYQMGPAAGAMADALLSRLEASGWDRVALVTTGGRLGDALQRDAQVYGLRIWPVVSPEGPNGLGEVMASGVGAILCDTDPVTAGEVVVTLRGDGWEGDVLGGPELGAADFLAVAGQAADGTVFVTPWPFPVTVSAATDFVADYRAVSNGVSPGPLAPAAYEATWVLVEALERDIAAHGIPTRDGMAAALSATERDGVLGHVTFDGRLAWGDPLLYWYRINVEGELEHLP